jgi:hypothetical protein
MTNINFDEVETILLDHVSFTDAGLIDNKVPDEPGFYCIKIKDSSMLPEPFASSLEKRKSNIVYMGLASKSLQKRFLGQELRAKSHGTFFRSLGAVLGYKPPIGSLKNKRNKRNYKFNKEDENQIINWINKNLIVNWVTCNSDLNEIETQLIEKYTPLFNISKNPKKLSEIIGRRNECVDIANT